MKRTILWLVCIVMLTGCTAKPGNAVIREGATISSLVDEWSQAFEVANPTQVSGSFITELYQINEKYIEGYAGTFSLDADCPDQILIVLAQENRVIQVQRALENRLQFVQAAFERTEQAADKANYGQVVVIGRYVVLAIVGRMEQDAAEEAQTMRELIERSITLQTPEQTN